MLETYFSASKMLKHLRGGPSGPYLDDFAAALERQGYSPATAVRYLRAAAHLGQVMVERGAGLDDIDLAAFSDTCAPADVRAPWEGVATTTPFSAPRLFRQHLVEIGVCRTAAVPTHPAEPQLVAGFNASTAGRLIPPSSSTPATPPT